jgi:hypothetical protein
MSVSMRALRTAAACNCLSGLAILLTAATSLRARPPLESAGNKLAFP